MKIQKTWLLSGLLVAVLCACGSNKSEMITKDWKATELMLGDTKLTADAVGGVSFSFKADSSFSYTETGNTENGKWSLNKDGNKITLTYPENRIVVQNIKELTPEKLVVDYEEHGMKRSISLVPVAK
ncbi:MAG TPA: lipocalin family protein [Cytophagaceae bacterium]|jgi:hypothetical protein|nr:lipocalin family protein [Cytophagaceae bacterium]